MISEADLNSSTFYNQVIGYIMGITNLDVMTTKSGLDLKDCYLTFTAGPQTMPNPINMVCEVNESGKKVYYAHATLYVYASPEAKTTGLDPVETKQLRIPVDASGVFNILFTSLKQTYTNVKDDEQSSPQQSSDSPAQSDPSQTPADTNNDSNTADADQADADEAANTPSADAESNTDASSAEPR